MAKKQHERPVIVTTDKRGVFFGYSSHTDAEHGSAPALTLQRARNCVYWSKDVRGFMGLASTGPTKSCRIGPQAPSVTLRGITSVMAVSDDAVKAWESAPWAQ